MEFFGWITGLGNGSAEITFMVGGVPTVGTVSELLGDEVSAPAVTAEAGFEFVGWALTEGANEAIITASKVTYANVKDILAEGRRDLSRRQGQRKRRAQKAFGTA
jgi:hypothetical protein